MNQAALISAPSVEQIVDVVNPHLNWKLSRDKIALLALSGSRAYGSNFVNSDWDFIGVVIPPQDSILGLGHWESAHAQTEVPVPTDVRVYSPRKFVQMLLQGAVNNLEILFLPKWSLSPLMEPMLSQAHQFISESTLKSIEGHAYSTLKRYADPSRAEHGSKRKYYIETYGYDVSGAAHCLRWLWMGMDLAANPNQLTVEMRQDRQLFLWTVKSGKLSEPQVRHEIERNLTKLQELKPKIVELLGERDPKQVHAMANQALIHLHREVLGI